MATLLERVYDELIYLKIVKTQTEFGKKLGYKSRGTISNLLDQEEISDKVKAKLIEVFGVNPAWLDSNGIIGEIITNGNRPSKLTGADMRLKKAIGTGDDERGLIYVPIAAQAGYSRNFEDPVYVNQLDRLYIPGLPYKGDKYRYFDVEGDSMSPTIEDQMQVIGEFVEQSQWENVSNYYIYVIIKSNKFLIKRVFKKDAKTLVLISDNEMYPQELLDLSEVKEMWYVKRILDWRMPPPKTIKIEL